MTLVLLAGLWLATQRLARDVRTLPGPVAPIARDLHARSAGLWAGASA